MTHKRTDDDRDLRELFREARRADSRRAPEFDRMLTSKERPRPWIFQGQRLLAIGFSTTVLASLAVFGASWLLVPRFAPAPASVDVETTRFLKLESYAQTTPPPRFVAPPDPSDFQSPSEVVPTDEPRPTPAPENEILAAAEESPPVDRVTTEIAAQEEYSKKKMRKAGTDETLSRSRLVARGNVAMSPEQTTKFTDEYVQPPPVPGRFYENVLSLAPGTQDADGDGNPNVHGSRTRDFKAEVGGVANVDPLTGQYMSQVDPNPIEEMEAITAGAGVEFSRAQGGFANVVGKNKTTTQDEIRLREEPWNAEGYQSIEDNPFLAVTENPLSTFSIDVDTASYSNVRRFLTAGTLPPPDAVRIEELINYFDYDYPSPAGEAPFSTDVVIVDCPWDPAHRLARIGIKGREIQITEHAGSNLVFLIDVSGSMNHPTKLPLLQSALRLLVGQLTARDQVAIVAYAGSSGLVLDSTSGEAKAEITEAIDRLGARGSTNGGAGLRLAYRTARENFVPGGVNRVILATDGDFNVGVTSHGDLLRSIEKDAKNGIFLTALGFGYGNYQDDRLEHLADKGNGNYAYIDRLREAQKVLVDELAGTLITIAKDVKIQIEFNPLQVGAYRLIGYENRMLKKEDFNDDRKDAGEIGAGHTVTALYELVPPDKVGDLPDVDELKYQTVTELSEQADSGEAFTLKLRYKKPDGDKSHLLTFTIMDEGNALEAASPDVKFAAAVAQFGLLLRGSEHKGSASFRSLEKLALEGAREDRHGYRAEFLELVRAAESLASESVAPE
jgi:Ca-activated chloride channel family protein